MKIKYVLLILFLCFISFFSVACSKNKISTLVTPSSFNSNLVEKGKNHKVIDLSKVDEAEYHYYIFNNNGDIMFEETYYRIPYFSYLGNDILQVQTGGGNVSQNQYFNTDKNLISPIYYNPSLVENGKIVYMTYEGSKFKLIVRDLFDKSKFYKEYEREFSHIATPYSILISAKFIDSNKLQVTYLAGKDYKKVTEIISLN